MERYDPAKIEERWRRVWDEEHTWEVPNPGQPGFDDSAPKYYVLEMLPYPSGDPHVGHLKNYSIGDAIAHYRRRNGFQVVHPMGFDAFGLPAENNAIKTGEPPRVATERSIEAYRKTFDRLGFSFDWARELSSHEPSYYRWTQWIFLKLLERDLAYRNEALVHWCPLDDLDTIEWPEHVRTMQRNWIGRSHGAEVVFRCEELGIDFPVFTTRPDTLFGATFFVLAPEHHDVERLATGTEHEDAAREYVNEAVRATAEERGAMEREKTGVSLGRTVTNPVNGEEIPMFVADYVLMEYGTGAIMAVPGHDDRDHAFATTHGLPIRQVIHPHSSGDDVAPSVAPTAVSPLPGNGLP